MIQATMNIMSALTKVTKGIDNTASTFEKGTEKLNQHLMNELDSWKTDDTSKPKEEG